MDGWKDGWIDGWCMYLCMHIGRGKDVDVAMRKLMKAKPNMGIDVVYLTKIISLIKSLSFSVPFV